MHSIIAQNLGLFSAETQAYLENDDGMVENLDDFLTVLKLFPEAPVMLKARNNNNLKSFLVIMVIDPSFEPFGNLALSRFDITQLVPNLGVKVNSEDSENLWLPIKDVKFTLAQKVADILNRPLQLVHVFGSGRQEEQEERRLGTLIPRIKA